MKTFLFQIKTRHYADYMHFETLKKINKSKLVSKVLDVFLILPCNVFIEIV